MVLELDGLTTEAHMLAQRALCSAALQYNDSVVWRAVGTVKASMFAPSPEKDIYQAVSRILLRGETPDMPTVAEELEGHRDLDDLMGVARKLQDEYTPITTVPQHVRIIQESHARRRVRDLGERLAKAQLEPAGKVIGEALSELLSIQEEGRSGGSRDVGEVDLDELEQFSMGGGVAAAFTGYPDLDEVMGPMAEGEMVIVGGRAGMGKSTFCANVALNLVHGQNLPVVYYAKEECYLGVCSKLIYGHVGINPRKRLSKEECHAVAQARENLRGKVTVIDENATPLVLRSHIESARARGRLGAVIIDYIHLLMPDQQFRGEVERLTLLSLALADMAREFRVPFLVASQLSRAARERKDPTPHLTDLRGSGSLEQDARKVVLLHRPAYYDGTGDPTLMCIVAKNNRGPVGTVELTMEAEKCQVRSKDRAF